MFFNSLNVYTERNLFRILHKSEFTKIATHLFYFYCTNFSEFHIDISMPKIAKPIYEESTPLCLRKTHGTRTFFASRVVCFLRILLY